MLTWLSFLICAAASTSNADPSCHVVVPIEHGYEGGVVGCQRDGMMMEPEWLKAHPGWRIAAVRCSPGNKPVDQEAI
jgi:hypothetical protein